MIFELVVAHKHLFLGSRPDPFVPPHVQQFADLPFGEVFGQDRHEASSANGTARYQVSRGPRCWCNGEFSPDIGKDCCPGNGLSLTNLFSDYFGQLACN